MKYRIRYVADDSLYLVEIKGFFGWEKIDNAYPTLEEARRAVDKIGNRKPDEIVWTG